LLRRKGDLIYNETIYPHAPQNRNRYGHEKIKSMVNAYNIDAISIGNGTARAKPNSYRKLLLIERFRFYSFRGGCFGIFCIKIAREEFNYDVTVRGSISIGRRLSDPLAELVKLKSHWRRPIPARCGSK
jgi:uncharacterized protein